MQFKYIFLEMEKLKERIILLTNIVLESNKSININNIEFPSYLLNTKGRIFLTLQKLKNSNATEISKFIGIARADCSSILNDLVRLNLVKKRRNSRTVEFYIE